MGRAVTITQVGDGASDAVIVDLEDSVAADKKDAARARGRAARPVLDARPEEISRRRSRPGSTARPTSGARSSSSG